MGPSHFQILEEKAMDQQDADVVTQYELETWARCAEDYLDTFAGLTSQAVPLLLKAAETRPGSHILDLGSGPGHVAEMFAQAGALEPHPGRVLARASALCLTPERVR